MVVTAASAAATAAVTTPGGRALLGGLVMFLFMGALIGQEIFGFASVNRARAIQKSLVVAAVPLACAVIVVLAQQVSRSI